MESFLSSVETFECALVAISHPWLFAEVAHLCSAHTGHVVAPALLDDGLVAAPALADQCLCHLVLDVRPLLDLRVILHFFTLLGDVAQLVAQAAALLATLWDLASEDLKQKRAQFSQAQYIHQKST